MTRSGKVAEEAFQSFIGDPDIGFGNVMARKDSEHKITVGRLRTGQFYDESRISALHAHAHRTRFIRTPRPALTWEKLFSKS